MEASSGESALERFERRQQGAPCLVKELLSAIRELVPQWPQLSPELVATRSEGEAAATGVARIAGCRE